MELQSCCQVCRDFAGELNRRGEVENVICSPHITWGYLEKIMPVWKCGTSQASPRFNVGNVMYTKEQSLQSLHMLQKLICNCFLIYVFTCCLSLCGFVAAAPHNTCAYDNKLDLAWLYLSLPTIYVCIRLTSSLWTGNFMAVTSFTTNHKPF